MIPLWMQLGCGVLFGSAMIASVVLFRRGRVSMAVAMLLLAAFSFRLIYVSSPNLGWWDERYHALVAKNMIAHPFRPTLIESPALPYDFRNWQGNHVWLHKPPLALWLMAASMSVFGCETITLRLPSLLMSVGAVLLTFLIGRRLLGEREGFVAAYFHSVCAPLLLLAIGRGTTDHVDTAFVFFVELGVYIAIRCVASRWWLPALALAISAAILTKWLPGLIVLVVWQALPSNRAWHRRVMEVAFVLAMVVSVVAPWHVHVHSEFPDEARWEQQYNARHVFEVIEGHGKPFYFHFWNLVPVFGIVAPVAIAWFLIEAVRRRAPFMPAIAAWFIIPYVFFTLARTKLPSYVLLSSPAVFLIMAWFWARVRDLPWPDQWHAMRRIALAAIVLAPLVPEFAGIRLRRSGLDKLERSIALKMRQMPELAARANAVVFNVRHPIELMFFTPVTAYSELPPIREVLAGPAGARPIFVCDDGSVPLPEEWTTTPGVTILAVPRGF